MSGGIRRDADRQADVAVLESMLREARGAHASTEDALRAVCLKLIADRDEWAKKSCYWQDRARANEAEVNELRTELNPDWCDSIQ